MIAHMLLENISFFAVFLKRWNLEVKDFDLDANCNKMR